jgi:hypothetical protein
VTPKEAAILTDRLAVAFPSATFTDKNADAYARALLNFDATETQAAIDELISTAKFLPSIAEIRSEITRAQRDRAMKEDSRRALRIEDGTGRTMGPYPRAWLEPLSRMLESASSFNVMARRWFAERGKAYPGDPGEKFTRIAEAGARGEDVREMVERDVVG